MTRSTPSSPPPSSAPPDVFIIGDILGAGIYALVGEVSAEVGGAVWTSFLAAFVLALFTAFAYAELVSKYPRAAGAALYTHRAFRTPFFTFVVAFAVMSSGIASASTLARAFAGDYLGEFVDLPLVLAAIGLILIVAAINLRGIAESVWVNVVLTAIEVIGLILIVAIGVAALGEGSGDFSRLRLQGGRERLPRDRRRHRALLLRDDRLRGLGQRRRGDKGPEPRIPARPVRRDAIAGFLYLLVTLTASYVVPTDRLSGSDAALLEVVEVGPLGISTELFSFIALMAVSNSALINMIMASRIVYGMADHGIVSGVFGRVLPGRRTPFVAIAFTTAVAVILVSTGDLESLADTTVLLLLSVFTIVNVAVLVLRREEVEHEHFHAPAVFPGLGAIVSIGLIVDTALDDVSTFGRAGALLAVGAVLWAVNRLAEG